MPPSEDCFLPAHGFNDLSINFSNQVSFSLPALLLPLPHLLSFQVLESLVVAGMHAKVALEKMLASNQISRYNRETIKLTLSVIDDSCKDLKQAASSVCLLPSSHVHNLSIAHQLSSNLVLKKNPVHKSMISKLSNDLNTFVSAHLPGRQRLSVAIGISKFIKSQKPYKSFAQPLVNAIVNLFQQLDSQSYTELNLLHFLSFQNAFARTANKILEMHRLFSFGPKFSKISFSQLISPSETLLLAKDLNLNLPANSTSFKSKRLTQRLINNAQFRVGQTYSQSCSSTSDSCECSIRTVTIFVPKVSPDHECLSQDSRNVNKFLAKDGFYFLSDSKKVITVTEVTFLNKGLFGTHLIKFLNPPIIRVRSNTSALLTSDMSVYFPNNINDTISSFCSDKGKSHNLSITKPGAIRFFLGCNLTSAKDTILIQSSSKSFLNKTFQKDRLFEDFNLSTQYSFIPVNIFNQIEVELKNSLLGEDVLQAEMKRFAAQSWLTRLFENFASYLFPVVSVAAAVVLSLVVLLALCYCRPCCCGKLKYRSCCSASPTMRSEQDHQLVQRVEKLEAFFSYCITEKYHDIQVDDLTKN